MRNYLKYLMSGAVAVAAAALAICSCHNQGEARDSRAETQPANGRIADAELPSIPSNIPSQVKRYEGYTVSFNKDNGTPNWSAWELTRDETDGEVSRGKSKFWTDEEVSGCRSTDDYKHSGYDRGHLCPAADMKWSEQAMHDCFSMANIAPQDHSLNSGAWSTLEKKCRKWADRDGVLLIAAGPIYDKGDNTRIGEGSVRVPSAFFKVISAPYISKPRGIAFVYPNMSAPGNMQNYVLTIDELEKLTGYDFFPALPDDLENTIEATTSFKEWDYAK